MKHFKSFWAAIALMAAMTAGFSSCDDELEPPTGGGNEGGNTETPGVETPVDHSATAEIVNAAAADLSKLLAGREIKAAAWNDTKKAYVISLQGATGDLELTISASKTTVENAKISVAGEDVDGNTVWYWKSNGEFLKDANDGKISVDKIPSFKIENDKWMVSTTYTMDPEDNSLTYSDYAELCDWADADSEIDSFFASIVPEKTVGEGEEARTVAEFKLIDGTEFTIAHAVNTQEPPTPSEKTLKDIVSYEIKNIGSYTVDVVCTPTEFCEKYTATIWSTSEDSSFDRGPQGTRQINYEEMTAATLSSFKESLTPGEGMQQHLISTAAHTYTEQDLIKNTPYSSDECQGFDNLFPGKNPFAIYVMALDVDGNYYIEYKEINLKSTSSNTGSVTPTITLGTVKQKSIEATITAPGASKVIVYHMAHVVGTPSIADAKQQAKPIPYTEPIAFSTGEVCEPNTGYYVVAIAIDANGGVKMSSASVTTPAYQATGTASVTSASFTQQYCSELKGTVTVSEGAKALRTVFMDEDTFTEYFKDDGKEMSESEKTARMNQMFLDPKMTGFIYSHTLDGTSSSLSYTVEKILDVYKPYYAIWASVQDANDNWSKPQNLAAVANNATDATAPAGFGVYLEMKTTDDAVSFGSSGTLALAASQTEQTDPAVFPIDFTASGLSTVRIYAARPDVAGGYIHKCLKDNGQFATAREVISDTEYGNGHWTDVTVSGSSVHVELNVSGGHDYVILACGIGTDGKYTEPFNVAAALDSKAADATSTVEYSGRSYTIPYVYAMPESIGGVVTSKVNWNGTATATFKIVQAPNGTYGDGNSSMRYQATNMSDDLSAYYVAIVPAGATFSEADIKSKLFAAAEEKYNDGGSYPQFNAGGNLIATNGVNFIATKTRNVGSPQTINNANYTASSVFVFFVADESMGCKLMGYNKAADQNTTVTPFAD